MIEATIKQILPPGFQKSEFVRDHGFIDIVAPRAELRGTIARLIRLLTGAAAAQSAEPPRRLKITGSKTPSH